MPAHNRPRISAKPFVAMAMATVLGACEKNDSVRVYEVIVPPSAQQKPANAAPSTTSPAMGAANAASQSAAFTYSVPDSWAPQPLGPMVNRGSFLLPEAAGARPALTISSFPGTTGGIASNLNRWRSQLGLPNLPDDEVVSQAEKRSVGTLTMYVCYYEGTGKDGKPAAMAGAVIPQDSESWFFKLTGPQAAMAAARPSFDAFLGTIKPTSANSPVPEAPSAQPAKSAQTTPSEGPKVGYKAPESWQEMPASGMRTASFSISGPDKMNADVSLVRLAGSGGGQLQNVNLWRQQLGLEAIKESELAQHLVSETYGPHTWQVFDASSSGKILDNSYHGRIIAALLTVGENTWVLRMRGEKNHLEQEKPQFQAFLQSLQLP